MKHSKRGVTLIELMVVLCLVMLLASLACINFSFLDETATHAELNKLHALFFYVRQQSMTTNREIVLKIDLKNNSCVFDNTVEKLSSSVIFGFLDGAKGPPGDPQKIITTAATFPLQEIHFYPTGIISSGTIYLVDKNKKHMYAISNAVSTVSYMRLYRYYDGMWLLCEAISVKK